MPGWLLHSSDLPDLAAGCALLGSGGGGHAHAVQLALAHLLDRCGATVPIIDARALPADALVLSVGYVGAPVTLHEKLLCATEVVQALAAAERRFGRRPDAVIAAEIGGMNGLAPLLASAWCGMPVIDGDGMGRAFPLSHQISFGIHGVRATPALVADERGQVVHLQTESNDEAERVGRALCVAMGSKCFNVDYPMRRADVLAHAIPGSLSLARSIGAALRAVRRSRGDLPAALRAALQPTGQPVAELFEGRVVASEHAVSSGFGRGRVDLKSAAGDLLRLDFQNEFLIAWRDGRPVATTPDIISLLDADTLAAITSDTVRYGQRVRVLVVGAPALMATARALAVVGPRAFGYALDPVLLARAPAAADR
jgi:DUF917 family protein